MFSLWYTFPLWVVFTSPSIALCSRPLQQVITTRWLVEGVPMWVAVSSASGLYCVARLCLKAGILPTLNWFYCLIKMWQRSLDPHLAQTGVCWALDLQNICLSFRQSHFHFSGQSLFHWQGWPRHLRIWVSGSFQPCKQKEPVLYFTLQIMWKIVIKFLCQPKLFIKSIWII